MKTYTYTSFIFGIFLIGNSISQPIFAAESTDFILIDNNLTETTKSSQTTAENGEEKYEEANLIEIQKIGESNDFIEASSYCGNSQIETPETCDTNNFAGKTCQSFGYDKGHLLCLSNCQIINTSNCSNNPTPTLTSTPTPLPTSTYTGGSGGGGYIPTKVPNAITPSPSPTPTNPPTPSPITITTTPIPTIKPIETQKPIITPRPKKEVLHKAPEIPHIVITPQTESNTPITAVSSTSNQNLIEEHRANRENRENTAKMQYIKPLDFINKDTQDRNEKSKINSKIKTKIFHNSADETKNNPYENILTHKEKWCWIWILLAFICGCLTRFIGRDKKSKETIDDLHYQAQKLKQNL